MSLLVPINGQNYIIPETNEVGWGSNLDDFFVAISAGTLQKTGGSFTLSAETDFGSSYGLKSLYYKSRASNVAATGALRLANAETGIVWRNFLNNADLALTVNASNQLTFNGTPIESNSLSNAHILVGNASNIATDVAMSGNIGIDNTGATTIQAGVVVNSMVSASAAIAYSKLNLTGGIVNADVNSSAAIAYSKLNLSASIVNADVSASAAIAYSKLTLTGSIVNADINASAAIAYSKLALTGSIVNADISSSAAIGITKIANGTANQVLGTNAGASANEWKTLTSTSNQVTVTHGVGTATFSTPQDIATSSAVRFGSLTLGGALDASSILSLISTSKGFLPPVMTTTQKNAISTPTDGLIVFDSTLAQLFLRSASAWTPLSTGGGSGTVSSGTQYQLGYYAAGGTTVSGLTLITGSRALASDANGLPVAATTTATELGYVNGVTSAIQTQINTKAPTASPTFTGTVVIPTPFTLGATSVTTTGAELNFVAGVTSAIQTQLNLLAPKANPSFTGVALFGNGASGAPSISFASDTDTGIYRGGANDLIIQAGGVDQIEISTTKAIFSGLILGPDGLIGGPGFSFGADQDTGLYRIGANNVGLSCGGTKAIDASDSGVAILGTTTNNNAAAGYVGQTVSSVVATVSFPGNTSYGDLTSISLTAGDWLVTGFMQYEPNSSTTTRIVLGISTTTGNSSSGLTAGDNEVLFEAATTLTRCGPVVPSYRMSLSGTTIVYLKFSANYSVGTPQADGRITAVRIR